ncbi:MAG: hypothetical protein HFJ45_00970 [Clostridia bacterium]|nr:hypothetical protein [Clostridia bacterium]
MLKERFETELEELKKDIEFMQQNKNIMNEKNITNFLFSLEKHRFNLLDEVRISNSSKEDFKKIDSINSEYKVTYNKIFKIYIPEVLPKYKYIGNYTYKNILLNVANCTKNYKNLFKNKQVCIYIEVFDNKKKDNWDIDNKTIKPIVDGLVSSKVIEDDSISKMFYCVKGNYDKVPHTEVTIFDGKKFGKWIQKNIQK